MWICSICPFSFFKFCSQNVCKKKTTPPASLLCSNTIFTTYNILQFWYFWSPNECVRGSHTKQSSDTGLCVSHKCRLLFSYYFLIATIYCRKNLLKNFLFFVWKIYSSTFYFWRIFSLSTEFCSESYFFNSLKCYFILFGSPQFVMRNQFSLVSVLPCTYFAFFSTDL